MGMTPERPAEDAFTHGGRLDIRAQVPNILILLGLCFFLFIWKLGDAPFFDRGEPREAAVAQEAVSSGNWILPLVNGKYIPNKPPLFHWLGAVSAKAFGRVDEFTARLPSALLGLLGVLLIYFAAADLWGPKAGLAAGLILATTTEWWHGSTIARVDMTLAFFITACLLWFWFLYRKGSCRLGEALGLAALAGCATLAKGPLGALVPGFVIVAFLALRRDFGFLKKLHLGASIPFYLLVAGSWYGLATWQGGYDFFSRHIIDENFRTAFGSYGRHQPVYYFLPIVFWQMAPWSFFIPPLALFLYRQRNSLAERKLLFPLVWFVAVLVFFSLSSGKRHIYILSSYPAMALLLGAWWQEVEEKVVGSHWLTLFVGSVVALGYASIPGIYLARSMGLDPFRHVHVGGDGALVLKALFPPPTIVTVCVVLTAVAAVVLPWALYRSRMNCALTCMTVLAALALVVMKDAYYPSIANARTLKPFVERVTKRLQPGDRLLFYQSFDYGTLFYAFESRKRIPFYADATQKGEIPKPPLYVLMWEDEWASLRNRQGLRVVDVSRGRGPAGKRSMFLIEAGQVESLS